MTSAFRAWLWDCRSLLAATAVLAAWIPVHGMTGGAWPMLLLVAGTWAFEAASALCAVARKRSEHSSPRQVSQPIRDTEKSSPPKPTGDTA